MLLQLYRHHDTYNVDEMTSSKKKGENRSNKSLNSVFACSGIHLNTCYSYIAIILLMISTFSLVTSREISMCIFLHRPAHIKTHCE
jgi:hypothetical protein